MAFARPEVEARTAGGRRRRRWLLGFLCGAGLIWGGWAWWRDRRYHGEMEGIESQVVAGRYATACRSLEALLSWKGDPNGGIVYLLGSCELARGRTQAARDAWARVPPGTPFTERAVRGRLRLLAQAGRLAAAEDLVKDAAADRRNDRTALLVMLVPMYTQLGRIDEAERLVEDRWEFLDESGEGALEPAIKLLRQHIELTSKASPVEEVRAFLDEAARLAPDDDRVWLGRANLAIRTGAHDEAGHWLDACQRRRPDDLPAWRARLHWGLATRRVDAVEAALAHLPADGATPAQVHRLKARVAAARGDTAAERRELERLLAIDPADPTALNRLARLAEDGGGPDQAAEYRRRDAEMDGLRRRYDRLHSRNQPLRDAVEMAHLAERLGRRFEARAFLILALGDEPGREDLRRDLQRLRQGPAATSRTGRTLAEVIDEDRPDRG